jgi:carbonic anhydrase/acetyltransferase-like protein (isoleucine patch superfamily)
MPVYRLQDFAPAIAASAYIAPTATVIGRVVLQDHASVWFGATLRGDNEHISIGVNSNVQESAVLHTDPGFPLSVGANVTVGHQAMLHGCTIGDGSLIGIHAVVMNGAVIGKRCLVGAGAIVTERKVFPDGSLILGAPAKVVRELSAQEQADLFESAAVYVKRQVHYRSHLTPIRQADPDGQPGPIVPPGADG